MDKKQALQQLPFMQVALYVMCGGGFVGRSFAEQPKSAYLDDRISKRPFKPNAIEAARLELVHVAEIAGLNPENLPTMALTSSMGGNF